MSRFDEFPDAPLGAESFPETPPGTRPAEAPVAPPQAPTGAAIQPSDDAISEAMNPVTGEVVQLADPAAVAAAIDEARLFKREKLDPYINALERVVAVMGRKVGSGTMAVGEYKLVVSKKTHYQRDLPKMRSALRDAGLPEERIREVFVETVSLTASTKDLNQLASSNEEYARIIEEHTESKEGEPSTTVSRVKQAGG